MVLQELDHKDSLHVEFWDALMVLGDHALAEAKKHDDADRVAIRSGYANRAAMAAATGSGAGVHTAVQRDIEALLAGKARKVWMCKMMV